MKKMTCKQWGGSCDEIFRAKTFEGMIDEWKLHVLLMLRKKDTAHLDMFSKLKNPQDDFGSNEKFFEKMRREFDAALVDD